MKLNSFQKIKGMHCIIQYYTIIVYPKKSNNHGILERCETSDTPPKPHVNYTDIVQKSQLHFQYNPNPVSVLLHII